MFFWNLSSSTNHSLPFKWYFSLTVTSHDTFASTLFSTWLFPRAVNGSKQPHKELLKLYSTNCSSLPSGPWQICSNSAQITLVDKVCWMFIVPGNVLNVLHVDVISFPDLHSSVSHFRLLIFRRRPSDPVLIVMKLVPLWRMKVSKSSTNIWARWLWIPKASSRLCLGEPHSCVPLLGGDFGQVVEGS